MVKSKTIFEEIQSHLLSDKKPSEYLNKKLEEGVLSEYPLKMLKNLVDTPQSPKHHPEGSVWNHTLMVVDQAASRRHMSENSIAFMWAALLHDIGKAPTTRIIKGRITSYDHDREGERLAIKFLQEYTEDPAFITKVAQLVRWHMQVLFVSKNLPFANIKKMINEVSIDEIALLSLCDRLGRGGITEEKTKVEQDEIKRFIVKCNEYLTMDEQIPVL